MSGLPLWVRDWRVVGGSLAALSAVAALLVKRDAIVAAAVLSAPAAAAPGGGVAAPVPLGVEPVRLPDVPFVHLLPGRTYFATLATHGSVDAVANPDRVKVQAEKEGFRDVVVFTVRPLTFPSSVLGDFYVRGTYAREEREIPRHVGVFLGSVDVLDAWLASA